MWSVALRSYTYIWHNRDQHFVVASGIEGRDVLALLDDEDCLLLLSRVAEEGFELRADPQTRMEFARATDIAKLPQEQVYSWGDFCWVDFRGETFPKLSKQELAEILYFGQMVQPFGQIRIPGLGNRFLLGQSGFWFTRSNIVRLEKTHDIDALLNSSKYPTQ
jgi:hypothetical protein